MTLTDAPAHRQPKRGTTSDLEILDRATCLALIQDVPVGRKPFFVRLIPDEVTGRRIPLHPGGVTVEHLGPSEA